MMSLKPSPRPAAYLRIGVTGHRFNKIAVADEPRLLHEIHDALAALRHGIADFPPPARRPDVQAATLQIISPLAEGADRMVAKAALDQGVELIALLPFDRHDYARDFFTPRSRAEYYALLERASQVLELEGRHDGEHARLAAYSSLGVHLVEASDILIALWDGAGASGTGGTAEVVDLARRRGRPVLWLPTSGGETPPAARLLLADGAVERDPIGTMVDIARKILVA